MLKEFDASDGQPAKDQKLEQNQNMLEAVVVKGSGEGPKESSVKDFVDSSSISDV